MAILPPCGSNALSEVKPTATDMTIPAASYLVPNFLENTEDSVSRTLNIKPTLALTSLEDPFGKFTIPMASFVLPTMSATGASLSNAHQVDANPKKVKPTSDAVVYQVVTILSHKYLFAADFCHINIKATHGDVKVVYAALKGDPARTAKHQVYIDHQNPLRTATEATKKTMVHVLFHTLLLYHSMFGALGRTGMGEVEEDKWMGGIGGWGRSCEGMKDVKG
ncbi:hypothetical protein K439DRAFT_1613967 [Ramaria rubella]|nr:hypothetical protein K439DRAFT_1613967 [Ramaria rubella]